MRGGAEECLACGVRRDKQARVVSSVYGRKAAVTYTRGGETLSKRPPCVDERQPGLFDVRPDDE